MCGIAGYFGTAELNPEAVENCLRLMERRGPDFSTSKRWTNREGRNAYLLFSRLSIIDLDERSNQPFNVGTRWMVFNGELYNYMELRAELKGEGRDFKTQSDTEVLLQTIDHFGLEGLDRCEGMWAFAVYDERDGTLTLSRDRFGEKPLYLYRDATGLYFGSEAKFIMALLGRRLEINIDHVYRFLVNGYKALYKNQHTFFKDLAELPPSSVLTIAASGKQEQHKYWTPRFDPDESMPYVDAVEGARARLIRSVELRLRADVPLAFCMSGGVDSNSLISIAKRICGYDVHGFTVTNEDER
ncbi:MAG TPA: asparagine synthetase B, partial [Blastocatellia bacterium]|nr:asparagine synthetase B [Blastocatellia bacterium]